ncbi:MAG: hypothetical protein PHG85_05780 [Candidatus Altiarchaeota archaeon]|nr:hypothetical protein [Candidatus Altiarchaeota archaeon]
MRLDEFNGLSRNNEKIDKEPDTMVTFLWYFFVALVVLLGYYIIFSLIKGNSFDLNGVNDYFGSLMQGIDAERQFPI